MTIYQKSEKEKREKILKQAENIEKKYQVPSDSQTVGKMLDELLKVIKHADKDKIMFGMPGKLVHGMPEEKEQEAIKETSLIGYLIKSASLIKKQNCRVENWRAYFRVWWLIHCFHNRPQSKFPC
ncbi:hypothetical protein [Wolbachia endosymbiont of Zygogramma bicolorata]|uniref:hypothetical protein n=1 Tax=Wolbachia endosymbiont of Zygogramma bicolorata TaxID=3134048 RepID=UPI003DA91752